MSLPSSTTVKSLNENEKDTLHIPDPRVNAVLDYYWREKKVNSTKTSIIHPLIRERILSNIQSGKLTWDYLLQDNFIFLCCQHNTPVSVALRILNDLSSSGMSMQPGKYLLHERAKWYKEMIREQKIIIDPVHIIHPLSIDSHTIEIGSCTCWVCLQIRGIESCSRQAWKTFCHLIQQENNVPFPSYDYIIDNGVLQNLLHLEEELQFDANATLTYEHSDNEMTELILNCRDPIDNTILRLFALLHDMSDPDSEIDVCKPFKLSEDAEKILRKISRDCCEIMKHISPYLGSRSTKTINAQTSQQAGMTVSSGIMNMGRPAVPPQYTDYASNTQLDGYGNEYMNGNNIGLQIYIDDNNKGRRSGYRKRRASTLTNVEKAQHKCPYEGCDYVAHQTSSLKVHLLKHTGEKPFKCPYEGCNYASTTSGHLNIHVRTHTGEKPYKCYFEGCNFAAAQSSNLKSHIKKNHSYFVFCINQFMYFSVSAFSLYILYQPSTISKKQWYT